MTKQQTTVRVSPDTLAAIDAEAERLGVSRGNVIDRWLAAQAKVQATNAAPLEQQAWYRAGELVAKARDTADRIRKQVNEISPPSQVVNEFQVATASTITMVSLAIRELAEAIDILAGTAPE